MRLTKNKMTINTLLNNRKPVKKAEMLQNAKRHCFFVGLNDSGAELCRANAVYGIAGIHYIQKQLGLKPNATFITTADMTITRNTSRWRSGFGYGGKVSWGDLESCANVFRDYECANLDKD